MIRGEKSGQRFVKCCEPACGVDPPPLKSCMGLAMKLEVKYLFPTSSRSANVYISQLPDGRVMRKILSYDSVFLECLKMSFHIDVRSEAFEQY